jgi:hypothetical protein
LVVERSTQYPGAHENAQRHVNDARSCGAGGLEQHRDRIGLHDVFALPAQFEHRPLPTTFSFL